MNNRDHAYAAAERLRGKTRVLEIEGITHFEIYRDEAFERSAREAAAWLALHLSN